MLKKEAAVKEDEEEVSDKGSDSEEEEINRDSQSEKDDGSDRDSDREQDEKQNKDDEAEWQELQQSIQRKERALLETKSKITHPVFSLYFPENGWESHVTKTILSKLQLTQNIRFTFNVHQSLGTGVVPLIDNSLVS
ncbi:secretory subunit [Saguinus oedipus]|uniref:Secretory subunit n=1 Tax=Saguinus oedipus TaxID=9490 RepID=A0ABQ9VXN7_SAGOE|nr:secretory subunit [Saguinus oedipus]